MRALQTTASDANYRVFRDFFTRIILGLEKLPYCNRLNELKLWSVEDRSKWADKIRWLGAYHQSTYFRMTLGNIFQWKNYFAFVSFAVPGLNSIRQLPVPLLSSIAHSKLYYGTVILCTIKSPSFATKPLRSTSRSCAYQLQLVYRPTTVRRSSRHLRSADRGDQHVLAPCRTSSFDHATLLFVLQNCGTAPTLRDPTLTLTLFCCRL